MRYRLQRHDGTDCSATMVPITVLRMVPIQRYRHPTPLCLILHKTRLVIEILIFELLKFLNLSLSILILSVLSLTMTMSWGM